MRLTKNPQTPRARTRAIRAASACYTTPMTTKPTLPLLCAVVGARPNFIKMAPVVEALTSVGFPILFVHTGQHYDEKMSAVFFDDLQMPKPDIFLGVGSGSHAEQTAKVLVSFEQVLLQHKPARVIVAGDVNSTLACTLAASKLGIPVDHVESGLRSFDRTMPEELNRIATDHLSDALFVTEQSGVDHLCREGISPQKIYLVGNTMIDSLCKHRQAATDLAIWQHVLPASADTLQPQKYAVVTLHRPANVDSPETAKPLVEAIRRLSQKMPTIFPIHPRTLGKTGDLWRSVDGLHIIEPLGYLQFLSLMTQAAVVVTDSGGIQEETTALGVPCLTLRPNTERPSTIDEGSNQLISPLAVDFSAQFDAALQKVLDAVHIQGVSSVTSQRIPALWDGHAAQRIAAILLRLVAATPSA